MVGKGQHFELEHGLPELKRTQICIQLHVQNSSKNGTFHCFLNNIFHKFSRTSLEALSPPVSAMCVRKNRNCPAQAVTAVQATQVPCSTRGAAQSVTPRRSGRSTQAVLTRITQNTKGDFGATPSEHHVCVLLSTVPVLNVKH